MTHTAWLDRVSTYVDQLEQIAGTLEMSLSQARLRTSAVNLSALPDQISEWVAAVGQLESMVAERETLLSAADAPAKGTTLIEKLASTGTASDLALMQRCKEVAATVSMAHHCALSLFVCQYHLASFSSDVLRLLSGADAPPTYQSSVGGVGSSEERQRGGGRLFNDAA
ncbi:hypothetical protein [Novipirellula artificiosorum]|uniref:FlgN protein n=1 Tax=Novipirellula artificiosorum TaxID=2528016 RepID=A0A5C6DFE8_9BACT|nr:hypothetical protein [Novipirellula artificiosorum]TWU34461.1 hypothetical protein Poly41_46090 [Novipirellula artificiosorum]